VCIFCGFNCRFCQAGLSPRTKRSLEIVLTNLNERRTVVVFIYRREAACYTLGYNYSLFAHRVHDVLTCIAAVAGIAGAAGVHLMGTGAIELQWTE
jgi:hypothetical protein